MLTPCHQGPGSLFTDAAVSPGGVIIISFVGLIVTHMARVILGPDHVSLLPVTPSAGSIFLISADTLARTALALSGIPVGLLTAFIGDPFLLYLLPRTRPGYSLRLHSSNFWMCPFPRAQFCPRRPELRYGVKKVFGPAGPVQVRHFFLEIYA
jgi:hypothetical protein